MKQLAREVISTGEYTFSRHAREQLITRGLDDQDVVNVLRAGWAENGEFENGSWRYKVRTSRIVVVVTFLDDDPAEVLIVTAWRDD